MDSSLVAQFQPTVLDFVQQVNDEFIPVYAGVDNGVGWTSVNSLFAAFFGINDVGNSYSGQNATLNDDIFVVYARLVDQVCLFPPARGRRLLLTYYIAVSSRCTQLPVPQCSSCQSFTWDYRQWSRHG